MSLTLGSLFSGIGGFELAGTMCGMTPIWASEVSPFPMRVTEKRFPHMRQLGDVAKIDGAKIAPVDVITFGSPCQSLSVAGKREGLKHVERGDEKTTRSGMFFEAVRVIREMRESTNGVYPRIAVWENVPGAFSSNGGEDFRCVLEELAKIGDGTISIPRPEKGKWLHAGEIVGDGFSIAWRVLDAQYFGTAQRRRRVFLIADFGGERAGKILFEREGVLGNPETRGTAREDHAGDAERGTGRSGEAGRIKADVVYSIQGNCIDRSDTAGCNGRGWNDKSMYTLNTIDRPAVVYDCRGNGDGKTVATLTGDHNNRVTDYTTLLCMATGQSNAEITCDISPTITDAHEQPIVAHEINTSRRYVVRRLTPLECCRLQGFPDGWCAGLESENPTEEEIDRWSGYFRTWDNIQGREKPKTREQIKKWLTKPGSEQAEYMAYGNSVAVPCVCFVLSGIAEELRGVKDHGVYERIHADGGAELIGAVQRGGDRAGGGTGQEL